MELYQLKTFLAVAAERNLTRAAERVHTSAPAVSAQLKALEEELGVRLFDRSSRGMALTPAGERLLVEARRTLDAAQALRGAAAEIRGTVEGVVRMGVVTDPVRMRLGDVMVTLAQRHPGVALRLQQTASVQSMDDVRRGQLDAAYVFSDSEAVDGLRLHRLAPVGVVPVLPVRWSREGGVPASLDELLRRPWVANPPSCGLRAPLEALFREAGLDVPDRAMADSEAAIRGMVASGLGAGLLREDQARDAAAAGEAVIWDGWRAQTWLCWIEPGEGPTPGPLAALREAVGEAWGRAL